MIDQLSRDLVGHKIKSVEQLIAEIGSFPRDKKVIMCHGTFDVVHPGHVRHLLYAKRHADILVASLTADAHIAKANFRPYVPQDLRAINLAALEIVDYVIVDTDPTPLKNLKAIEPDYFAKGYEYSDGAVHPKTEQEIEVLDSYGGEVIFTPGDIIYSSSSLIEASPPNLGVEKLLMLMSVEGINFQDLRATLAAMSELRVHVVGDTIVDSFTRCSMIGGMTKTPTMSVRYEEKDDYVGGAGVVAKHLRAAGADVVFSTVLGDDAFRDFVLADLEEAGVLCEPIVDATRPTTNKNAIISDNYRLLKIDTLDNRSISEKILSELTTSISKTETDIVVFSDFRHGVFNRETIPNMIEAIPRDVLRVADSQVASRWGNILEFQDFDLITPNEREARFALGDQDSVVRPLAQVLHERSNCKLLILKLGARGTLTFRNRPEGDPRAFYSLESFAGDVTDAVGAGDALLAYSALALKATGNDVIASVLGAIAAGVECEHDGNIPVTADDVHAKIEMLERQANYR